ncbi:unnamed protein product, partial [Candidula unifasciata]
MAYTLAQAMILLTVSESCLATDYIPPKITFPNSSFSDFYFQNGAPARVTCMGDGRPLPTFQWLENDLEMQPSLNINYNPITGDLNIVRFSIRYQTSYRCVASNQYQQVNVSTMSIKIHLWQLRLENFASTTDEIKHVMEYRYLQLMCRDKKSSIAPKLTYNWYNTDTIGTLNLGAGRLYIDQDGTLHFTYALLGDRNIPGYSCGISGSRSVDFPNIQLGKKYIINVTEVATSENIKPKLEYSNTVHLAFKNSTGILECMYSG